MDFFAVLFKRNPFLEILNFAYKSQFVYEKYNFKILLSHMIYDLSITSIIDRLEASVLLKYFEFCKTCKSYWIFHFCQKVLSKKAALPLVFRTKNGQWDYDILLLRMAEILHLLPKFSKLVEIFIAHEKGNEIWMAKHEILHAADRIWIRSNWWRKRLGQSRIA